MRKKVLSIIFILFLIAVAICFHPIFKEYSDAFMVLITFVYAITTIQMLEEGNETRRLEHVPYIKVNISGNELYWDSENIIWEIDLISSNSSVCSHHNIFLINVGLGLALNIKYRIEGFAQTITGSFDKEMLEINEQYHCGLDLSADVSEKMRIVDAKLVLCFNDLLDNQYEQVTDMKLEINQASINIVELKQNSPHLIGRVRKNKIVSMIQKIWHAADD